MTRGRMKRNVTGNSTVLTLIIVTVLASLVGAMLQVTTGTGRNAQRSRAYNQAINVGLGSFELAFSSWRATCRPFWGQPVASSDLSGIPTPVASDFPSLPGTKITNFSVQATDPQLTPVGGKATVASGQNTTYAAYSYLASVDISVPVVSGSVTTRLQRVFQQENTSPWTYAIFYNDPLEIHPGPLFTVTGLVHTNDILYTAHDTLTFAGKTTFSDQWSIGYMPGDGAHDPLDITSPYYPTNAPPVAEAPHAPFGQDAGSLFSTTDANSNNDGWREIVEIPVAAQTDAFANGRYYNQAYVKVLVNASNALTVINQGGTTVNASSTGNNLKLYNAMVSAITTNQTIQDNREAASVRLVTLDVSKINTAIAAGNMPSFNGVIYIADTSATATTKRGVRIKNGQVLPTGGLAIATQNPAYIQGDYNTGAGTPASNTGDPTKPSVSGYTRQPSVVAADAVNVLSGAWLDANSSLSLASRVATNTTVNTAILAGIVPTGTIGSNYSGGAENFPRFHEKWNGVTFTYYGSMVQLFSSKEGVGPWGNANVYGAPTRNWYFDPILLTSPPPGGLVITNYNKGRWYLR